MIWAAAVLASQRQPALVPEALPKAKPDKGPPLSLEQINKVYDNGHPSNKLSAGPESAGLVVHMYDLTERAGTGQMYQPGDAQFQEFWATSVVNRNLPGMYEPPTGGGPCNGVGILINPEAAKVLCACARNPQPKLTPPPTPNPTPNPGPHPEPEPNPAPAPEPVPEPDQGALLLRVGLYELELGVRREQRPVPARQAGGDAERQQPEAGRPEHRHLRRQVQRGDHRQRGIP